jgi:hypothetical protein
VATEGNRELMHRKNPFTHVWQNVLATEPFSARKVSLFIGGHFHGALARMHLTGPGSSVLLRVSVLVLLTWVPLLALSLAQGAAFGNKVKIQLLSDFSVWGRFWAALPLLIIAEAVIDPRIKRVVTTFDSSGIISDDDLPAYCAALEKIGRLRDSRTAELLFIALAALPAFLLIDSEWISNDVSSWHGSISGGLSPAGWWFASISGPVVRFLLLRWLWRYALWSVLLYKIGNLNLKLMPTHPDRVGGLGFVLLAQRHFGILFAALGAVIAGQYADSIAYFGTMLKDTRAPMVVFVLISLLVVLGPLTMLSPRLADTKRNAVEQYSQLGRRLTASFTSKWLDKTDAKQEAMLGSQDPSSLVDLISTFQVIRGIQVIPVSKELIIQVAAQAAAPFALLWLFASPIEEIVRALFKMIF